MVGPPTEGASSPSWFPSCPAGLIIGDTDSIALVSGLEPATGGAQGHLLTDQPVNRSRNVTYAATSTWKRQDHRGKGFAHHAINGGHQSIRRHGGYHWPAGSVRLQSSSREVMAAGCEMIDGPAAEVECLDSVGDQWGQRESMMLSPLLAWLSRADTPGPPPSRPVSRIRPLPGRGLNRFAPPAV
jgi:hypothetical protein